MDTILLALSLFFVINIIMFVVILYNFNNLSSIVNQLQIDENGTLIFQNVNVTGTLSSSNIKVTNKLTSKNIDVNDTLTSNNIDVDDTLTSPNIKTSNISSNTDEDIMVNSMTQFIKDMKVTDIYRQRLDGGNGNYPCLKNKEGNRCK